MDEDQKDILRINEVYLKENTSFRKNLLTKLFAWKVITDADRDEIEDSRPKAKQVRALLTILKEKPNGFDKLCDALRQDEQGHIADKLQPGRPNGGTGASATTGSVVSGGEPSDQPVLNNVVMISYSWTQSDIIDKIENRLEKEGFGVWRDKKNMGDTLYAGMADGIKKSNVVLLCLSKEYAASDNCELEWQQVKKKKKRFIPLIVQNGYRPKPDSALELMLGDKVWIDLSADRTFSSQMDQLIQRIKN